jgi:hypothetical protein
LAGALRRTWLRNSKGIAVLCEIGSHLGLTFIRPRLAAAQACEDAVADALETARAGPTGKPTPMLGADITRVTAIQAGQHELAETDLLQAMSLARKISAKA